MQPTHYDLLNHHGQEGTSEPRTVNQLTRDSSQMPHDNRTPSHIPAGAFPLRSDDSWIEVSSQPSSSSLSSATTNDEIVTTGLRIEHHESTKDYRNRRRRLRRFTAAAAAQISYPVREPSSSQGEDEESESEPDRVLNSSNEDIAARSRENVLLLQTGSHSYPSEVVSSSDEDRTTALATQISPSPFVPQPNVFSHPPASQPLSGARASNASQRPPGSISSSSRRHSSNSTMRNGLRRQQHGPYNMILPSHQADHDAALRASLSTLLSCAAAARGLPKDDAHQPSQAPASSADQPATFRLVSESEMMGEEQNEEDVRPRSPMMAGPSRHLSERQVTRSEQPTLSSKARRRASSPRVRSSLHPSVPKKSRRNNIADSVPTVSPTLMTWVISAGVVVLFSAISFSAGYALGREVGRTESGGGMGSLFGNSGSDSISGTRSSAGCGREAVNGGLKRFRWSAGAAGSSVSV
jgi:hypothetical protein